MSTNHDLVEVFLFTPLIDYGLHTNPSFGAGLPDFKRTYLRPQEELENVLTIQIEPKFSALSVYEVFRAIPVLLHPRLEEISDFHFFINSFFSFEVDRPI